jgi:hypothetical protein
MVEAGLGEETVEEAGLVPHPPESGLHQPSQLADVLLAEVGQGPFQVGQTGSTVLSSGAYGGSWKTLSQSRVATSSRIARLT